MTDPATAPATPLAYEDATRLLENPPALRRRAGEEGLLYFRKLLPEQTRGTLPVAPDTLF